MTTWVRVRGGVGVAVGGRGRARGRRVRARVRVHDHRVQLAEEDLIRHEAHLVRGRVKP